MHWCWSLFVQCLKVSEEICSIFAVDLNTVVLKVAYFIRHRDAEYQVTRPTRRAHRRNDFETILNVVGREATSRGSETTLISRCATTSFD